MAAPTFVRSYSQTFSSTDTFNLDMPNGLTGGDSVIVVINQIGSINRGVTGVGDGTNSYASAVQNASGTVSGAAKIFYKDNVTGVANGTDMTVTLDGNSEVRITIVEISPATFSTLTDTYTRTSSDTAQQCGATGLTTSADVFVIGTSVCSGDHLGATAGDGYTTVNPAGEHCVLYKSSDAGLTSTVAPWTSTASRFVVGSMAAWNTAGGGGSTGQPTMKRWGGTFSVGIKLPVGSRGGVW